MPQAIIMAGGQGERFWPLTHKKFPKYRIKLDGKASLLQKTYQRLLKIYGKSNIHVVTTKDHFGMIRQELPQLSRANILIEPERKNTAAAIFLSTAVIERKFGPEEVVSFYPADHLIENVKLFSGTIKKATALAKKDKVIVTIGIQPTFPAIGYGYIEAGRAVAGIPGAFRVKRFREKPDRQTALRYIKKRNFFWNGGIFTWRAGVFMSAIKKFSPAIHKNFKLKNLNKSYHRMPKLSIDYALMEKANNIAVVKTAMDWCDMGSWDMFMAKATKDKDKNFIYGNVRHRECQDSLLINHEKSLLTVLGVTGLIAVRTAQGTLVTKRTRSEEAALLSR